MKTKTYQIWEQNEYSCPQVPGFTPDITSYLHEDGKDRPCMLVVPGGAYCFVSDSENKPVAKKFYEAGYQVFVLTYTTNPHFTVPLKLQPLKDISRAVRFIRKHAGEFGILDNQVAVCGFSAGGHLCASLCVHHEDITDENERYRDFSNRPNAAILCYSVITSGPKAHRDSIVALLGKNATPEELEYMSLETQVTRKTPPCFIWTTAEDRLVPADNSIMFAESCFAKGIPSAFHLFSQGDHGLSICNEEWAQEFHGIINSEVAVWSDLACEFLKRFIKF